MFCFILPKLCNSCIASLQPNASTTPILRNELDAGRFQGCLDRGKGARLKLFTTLQP